MTSPFVLVSSAYGPMIVNRLDTGVGWQIFETGTHEAEVVNFGLELIDVCLENYGDGVQIIDVGANIGACTIPWAKRCGKRGMVTAFEPQQPLYYALAGNVALNNLFNVKAIQGVVSDSTSITRIPKVDYEVSSNFGGIAMRDGLLKHGPGQTISYDREDMLFAQSYVIDLSSRQRLDFIKIDVEGMEVNVLDGATNTIKRLKPVLITEWIHCGNKVIADRLPDFIHYTLGGNVVSVHKDEQCILDFVKSKLKS